MLTDGEVRERGPDEETCDHFVPQEDKRPEAGYARAQPIGRHLLARRKKHREASP